MPTYSYKCNKCGYMFNKYFTINNRDQIVGDTCNKCKEGKIIRTYQPINITFDMLKSNPSDLKLVIDRLKDKAKLDSIVDEENENE